MTVQASSALPFDRVTLSWKTCTVAAALRLSSARSSPAEKLLKHERRPVDTPMLQPFPGPVALFFAKYTVVIMLRTGRRTC